jgi:aspartate dehydrogenase
MKAVKKIGIIGCGAIGTGIAEFIQKRLKGKAKISAVCDIDPEKALKLSKKIKPALIAADIETLIKKSDLVIEAAGMKVSGKIAEMAVAFKKDVLIMSTGGLLKKRSLFKKAESMGCNIYVPGGAICGLDGICAAGIGKIYRVTLTTRKPPGGLKGAPYLKDMDLDGIEKETVVYEGTAAEAVKHFPQNINVAATLSLSGIGPKRTKVKIITSPEYTKNIHEIEIEGDFGRIWTRTENVPSPVNPKTSTLAIFSALAKLKEVL